VTVSLNLFKHENGLQIVKNNCSHPNFNNAGAIAIRLHKVSQMISFTTQVHVSVSVCLKLKTVDVKKYLLCNFEVYKLKNQTYTAQANIYEALHWCLNLQSLIIILLACGIRRTTDAHLDPLTKWSANPEIYDAIESYYEKLTTDNQIEIDAAKENIHHLINTYVQNQNRKQVLLTRKEGKKYWWKAYQRDKKNLTTNTPLPESLPNPSSHQIQPTAQALTTAVKELFNQPYSKNCETELLMDSKIDMYDIFNDDDEIENEFAYTTLYNNSITPNDIKQALQHVKNKTPGISSIPMNFYKICFPQYQHCLCYFYNISSLFPKLPQPMTIDVKVALPKYKYNATDHIKNDSNNYRFIALQNSVMKIYDTILHLRLTEWVNKNNYLSITQGGFRTEYGTCENLFLFQQLFALTPQLYTAFIDLRKAYDSINRKKLFQKLKNLHICPTLLKLLAKYYLNTSTVVRDDEWYGIITASTTGLPQGAISSPILFNLYINDLTVLLQNSNHGIHINANKNMLHYNATYTIFNHLLFADDILLFADSHRALQKLIQITERYAVDMDLKFNFKKSSQLNAGNAQLTQEQLKNLPFQLVETQKYLGIEFDPHGIDIKSYFNKVLAKAYRNLYMAVAFSKKRAIPIYQRLTIYKTVIRSCIEYGSQIIMYSEGMIAQFETLQKVALKMLFGIPTFEAHPDAYLLVNNILPIKHRFNLLKLKFFFKIFHKGNSLLKFILNFELTRNPNINSQEYNPQHHIVQYRCEIANILHEYGQSYADTFLNNITDTIIPLEIMIDIIDQKIHQTAMKELSKSLHTMARQQQHMQEHKEDIELSIYPPILTRIINNCNDEDLLVQTLQNLAIPNLALAHIKWNDMLPDVSRLPIHLPNTDPHFIPSEIYRIQTDIWRYILLTSSTINVFKTKCELCDIQTSNPTLHLLLECKYHHRKRTHQIHLLQNSIRINKCPGPIQNKINKIWLQEILNNSSAPVNTENPFPRETFHYQTRKNAYFETLLLKWFQPTIIDPAMPYHITKIIRASLITLAALILPQFANKLRPTNWIHSSTHNTKLDLKDYLAHKKKKLCNPCVEQCSTCNHC